MSSAVQKRINLFFRDYIVIDHGDGCDPTFAVYCDGKRRSRSEAEGVFEKTGELAGYKSDWIDPYKVVTTSVEGAPKDFDAKLAELYLEKELSQFGSLVVVDEACFAFCLDDRDSQTRLSINNLFQRLTVSGWKTGYVNGPPYDFDVLVRKDKDVPALGAIVDAAKAQGSMPPRLMGSEVFGDLFRFIRP
ncbi:hypothetical protein HK405_002247 [Cladochytrium tenue]|nr:hypothetical protein HK405_002247 [Cladochytrium tenue]